MNSSYSYIDNWTNEPLQENTQRCYTSCTNAIFFYYIMIIIETQTNKVSRIPPLDIDIFSKF